MGMETLSCRAIDFPVTGSAAATRIAANMEMVTNYAADIH